MALKPLFSLIFALFLFAKNNLPFKTFESLKNKVEFFGRWSDICLSLIHI